MKCVGLAIGGDFPALSQGGDRTRVRRVQVQQAIKECLGGAHLGNTGDDRRIKRFRLVAVYNDEISGTFAAKTTGEEKAEGQKNERCVKALSYDSRSIVEEQDSPHYAHATLFAG